MSKWNNPDGSRMTCVEDACVKEIRNSGLCSMHYTRRKRSGTLPETPKWTNSDGSRATCSITDCSKPVLSNGWCSAHYTRMLRHGSTDVPPTRYLSCAIPHCEKQMLPNSVICKACYQKSWRYGLTAEQFIEMCLPENYHCYNPGCSSDEKLHIDHDHSCCLEASSLRGGKKACGNCVRGWLCNGCNTALGLLKEDTGRIAGLIEYLRR